MNPLRLSLFLAQRLQNSHYYKHSVSARIIKIATVAVALGIAMILIALATGFGLQKEIASKTAIFNGHLSLSSFENNSATISIEPLFIEDSLRKTITSLSNLSKLDGVTYKAGLFKSKSTFEGGVFKGVGSNYPWGRLQNYLKEGEFPNSRKSSQEVLISQTLASRLELEVGDRFRIFFQNNTNQKVPNQRTVKVVGIYQSGFPEFDESLIFGSIDLVNRVNQWDNNQVGSYEVVLNDFEGISNTAEIIYNMLPSEWDVITIQEKYPNIFQWIALFDYNILIILTIMIIVGVINMATALLVLILERTRMIGVLQTIGATSQWIQSIFLWSGARIFSVGLFWGNLLGLSFYWSQLHWKWIRLDPQTYFVETAPVFLTISHIVTLNIFVLLISMFFLWFPIRLVIRKQSRKNLLKD